MSSGSFDIDTFTWNRSLPLSNATSTYSSMTMLVTGKDGFLTPYSFYDYTTALKFPDTSTFSTSITSFLDTSLKSTVAYLGKPFISTIPTQTWVSTSVNSNYPQVIKISPVNLGPVFSDMINSKQYNVFVESQYSILAGANNPYLWISTVGVFNDRVNQSYGRTTTTRVTNSNYMDINTKFIFVPQQYGSQYQIPPFTSTFHLEVSILYSSTITNNSSKFFDIYVPGENNYTFTLTPTTSTILN